MYKLSLCNGDLTVDLVEMKAIPALMHICKTSKVVSVLENAIGALGGIAAKSVDNRNLVISAGVVNVILGLFKAHEKNLAFLKTCAWAASNLPRGGGNWPNDERCYSKNAQSILLRFFLSKYMPYPDCFEGQWTGREWLAMNRLLVL